MLAIDTIGPILKGDNTTGFNYIIVIVDCFTRFVELYPSKSTTAKEAAVALHQHTGRYGIPRWIRTDNGSQFCNEMIKCLADRMGVELTFTTPYSSEENSIVERQ